MRSRCLSGYMYRCDKTPLACDPENIEILCVNCHAKEHPEFKGMLLKKRFGEFIKCEICEKLFYIKKTKVEGRRFCNIDCYQEIRKLNKTGR